MTLISFIMSIAILIGSGLFLFEFARTKFETTVEGVLLFLLFCAALIVGTFEVIANTDTLGWKALALIFIIGNIWLLRKHQNTKKEG